MVIPLELVMSFQQFNDALIESLYFYLPDYNSIIRMNVRLKTYKFKSYFFTFIF